eukprot:1629430-Ditylum_brightwellii.AAC.1
MQRQAKWIKTNNANGKIKYSNNIDKMRYHYFKQELNTIIRKNIKDTLKNSQCPHHNEEEANAINQIGTLSGSSRDNSNDMDKHRFT